jgi:allantoin racemase
MHIRVINPTITTSWEADTQRIYAESAGPGTKISTVSLNWGSASLESRRDQALVVPEILSRVVEAERESCDAVIIDCMADPGMFEARELVSIPVVGPGQTSMSVAAMLGYRFSVLCVLDENRPIVQDQVTRYGFLPKLASVRAFNVPVLQIDPNSASTLQAVVDASAKAIHEDDADVIVPGCTSLAGMAPRIRRALLERGLQVTVLDPPPLAVKLAEALVALGQSHSRRSFAPPNPKEIRWPVSTAFLD